MLNLHEVIVTISVPQNGTGNSYAYRIVFDMLNPVFFMFRSHSMALTYT